MPLLPSPTEAVYIGRNLWLHCRVLTFAESMQGREAMHAAVAMATPKPDEPDPTIETGPAAGLTVSMAAKMTDSMSAICRLSVFAFAQGEPDAPPTVWTPCTIVRNATDHNEEARRFAVASLDEAAPGWQFAVFAVAWRAAMEAEQEVRPLSETPT